MSHLAHIITVKKSLNTAGITSIEEQERIVTSAYIKTLIRVRNHNKNMEVPYDDFMRRILSYWNETYPVKGGVIITCVNKFFIDLNSAVNDNVESSSIVVGIPGCDFESDIKSEDIDGYKTLIETLYSEANRKLDVFGSL